MVGRNRFMRHLMLCILVPVTFISTGCARNDYARIVSHAREAGLVSRNADHLYLRVVGCADKAPVAGARLSIGKGKNALIITADSNGILRLPIPERPARRNTPFDLVWPEHANVSAWPTYISLAGRDLLYAEPDETLDVQFLDKTQRMPLAGLRITLLSQTMDQEFRTDGVGILKLPLSQALADDNPLVLVDHGNYGWIKRNRCLGRMEEDRLIGAATTFFYFCVMDKADRPVPAAKVRLFTSGGVVELLSDAEGIVKVPITDEFRREDPPYVIVASPVENNLKPCLGGADITKKRTRRNFRARGLTYVTSEGMLRMEGAGVALYYEEGCEEDAARVIELLRVQREAIQRVTGLEPVEWGVILKRDLYPGARYIARRPKSGPVTICFGVWETQGNWFSHVNTHEWAEATLHHTAGIYEQDSHMRFAGDGLAEYAAYLVAGRQVHDEAIEEVLREGRKNVDLSRDFRLHFAPFSTDRSMDRVTPLESACYGVSFVFWHGLCREYGEDLPARFIGRLKEEKKRNVSASIRILEDLTGDNTVRQRLESADLGEALKVIRDINERAKTDARPDEGAAASR